MISGLQLLVQFKVKLNNSQGYYCDILQHSAQYILCVFLESERIWKWLSSCSHVAWNVKDIEVLKSAVKYLIHSK
jgi:hypothetical protein